VLDQFFQEVVGPVHDDEMMTPRKAHESLVGRDDARAIPLGKLDRRLLIVRAMEKAHRNVEGRAQRRQVDRVALVEQLPARKLAPRITSRTSSAVKWGAIARSRSCRSSPSASRSAHSRNLFKRSHCV
jgi:hypothetical protein